GVKHWLWRAVDQAGVVLDVLVQRRRDKRTAKRRLRKLLKRQMRPPRVMITDKLAGYGAAKREVMPAIAHRQHKGLNKPDASPAVISESGFSTRLPSLLSHSVKRSPEVNDVGHPQIPPVASGLADKPRSLANRPRRKSMILVGFSSAIVVCTHDGG